MPSYLVTYRRPGGDPETEPVFDVLSDQAARNFFLGLPWVSWEPIEIVSVEPVEGRVAPLIAFDPHNARKLIADGAPRFGKAATQAAAGYDWRTECDRLTERIGQLADQAQAHARDGRDADAKIKREQAKRLSAERAAITKRSKGR